MSDILVTELVVDASGALAGTTEFEAASNRIVAASQRAAEASDSVSDSAKNYSASGQIVEASAAAQERALIRQSTAVGGTAGALEQLTRASKEVEIAQAAVAARIARGAISSAAGQAEMAKLTARHEDLAAATEKLNSVQSSLAGILVQYPNLLSAIGASASKTAANHAELAEAFEKFRTGGLSVSALVQQFPGLLGNVGNEAKSLVARYDELSSALSKYHANSISAATVTAAFPGLASATRAELDKLALNHANLIKALEQHKAGQLELSALITQFPGAVGPATSSLERYVKQHVDTAVAVAAVGAAHRTAVSPVKELGDAAEHANVNHRQMHGVMVLIRALLEGDWKRAFESGTVSAERFHLIHIAMIPAVLGTVGALVAFGAAVFLVAQREHEIETDLRSFNLQLSTIAATAGGPVAAGLKSLQDHLRDTGSSAADAKKAIDVVLQATPRGVNPAAAGTIVPLARDIGAATGTPMIEETKKLTDALAGGVDEMIKYGFAMGALTAPQAAAMRQLEEHGHAADAMRIAIDALTEKYGGAFQRSLSETQRLMIEVKNAWDKVLDTFAEKGVFQFLIDQLKGVVEGIRTTIDEFNRLKELIPQGIRDMVVPVKPFFGSGSATGSGATFDTRGLDTNSEALQRLTTVLGEASKTALPTGYALVATSTTGGTHTPGSLHYTGEAIDVQIVGPEGKIANRGADTTGLYSSLAAAAYAANQRLFPGTPLAWGGNFGVTPGSDVADLMHFDVGPQRGSLGIPLPQLAAARAALLQFSPSMRSASAADAGRAEPSPQAIADQQKLTQETEAQTDAVNKQAEANRKSLAVSAQVGAQRILAQAQLDAEKKATDLHLVDAVTRENFIAEQMATAKAKLNQQYSQGADLANLEATGTLKTADAYRQSTVEGLKASAMLQAQVLSRSSGIPIEQAYNQILTKNATDAIAAGSQQTAALNPVIEANARLADAASHGTAALHAAELQNEAISRTQDEVNKAMATGNQALIDRAIANQAALLVSIKDNETLKETLAIRTSINQSKDQVAVVQLETSLQGQTTDQIRAQVQYLQAQQHVKNDLSNASEKDKQAYLDQVSALINANAQLAEAERVQGRLNDAARSVADTITNQIGTALDDAFSGKKIENWGETLKTILRDILKQIVEFTLIRPAIGSALGALGFNQVAQQFGSFGDLFGGSGGGGGGGGSNLLSGASSIGGLFKAFGGLGSGSANSEVLSSLGLTANEAAGWSAADLLGSEVGAGADFSSAAGGGILGGLFSEGGALSGIGSVFSAISPVLPFIGPIAGIGSLIGGLLGNKKPSNFSSGDLLDLATGKVSGFQSSGNQQNDATVNQITKSLGDFTKTVEKLTGGSAAGSLAIQAGTRDGIKIGYSGPLGSFETKAADAQSAINQFELAIAQNLTGVSDTLKTVLAHITDPSQIQAAVTFAATYDNLKKAADSAFSSISTDVKTVGPFAQALDSLNKQFKDLTDQANQFGLSLDPINAGLAEATKRLQQDFGAALDQAINQGSGGDYVNQLIKVGQDFASNTREAIALGLGNDATTGAKISQLEVVQAQQILASLTADQLQKVVDTLGKSNPELAAMAQTILNTGVAATGATTALQGTAQALKDLSTGVKSLEDLALSLKTGPLSGLTPAAASSAANAAYQAQYQTVLSAGSAVTGTQLSDLAKLGQGAIEASRTAYGEAPQTADLRRSIIAGLDYVTALTGSSANLTAQAGSATASTLLTGSPAVQAAQLAAALAASSGLTSKVQGFAAGTPSTPAGWILVGERGPELINQSGGAQVIPISSNAAYQWRGPAFAAGTSGDPAMVDELRAMRAELMALRRQTQGGQEAAGKDAQQQVKHLSDINRKAGPGIAAPPRQKLG